jgi:hypothetical protein
MSPTAWMADDKAVFRGIRCRSAQRFAPSKQRSMAVARLDELGKRLRLQLFFGAPSKLAELVVTRNQRPSSDMSPSPLRPLKGRSQQSPHPPDRRARSHRPFAWRQTIPSACWHAATGGRGPVKFVGTDGCMIPTRAISSRCHRAAVPRGSGAHAGERRVRPTAARSASGSASVRIGIRLDCSSG